jgi:hypothetical protein
MNHENLSEALYARRQLDSLTHDVQRALITYSGGLLVFQRAYSTSSPEDALSALQMLRAVQIELELKLLRALELMHKLFPNEVHPLPDQRPPTA